MPEILRKPPSQIKIRTLETDVEDMRKSGGGFISGKVLGRTPEEINRSIHNEGNKNAVTFFPTQTDTSNIAQKKNKVPIIIIATIVGIGIIVGLVFYISHKPQTSPPIATPSLTPQYSSLLRNFNGVQEWVSFDLTLNGFEDILVKQFYTISEPQKTKELVFVKNNGSLVTASEFFDVLFDHFKGITAAERPQWENRFSFIVFTDNSGSKSIAYVTKIDTAKSNPLVLPKLKQDFSRAFENYILNNTELLTYQYLQNPGKPNSPFLPQTIGPLNASVLKFSTGAEFYYAFYGNEYYFLVATSKQAFEELLNLIVVR
ncbi:MAG: hypothetical protein WC579_01825 [Candidatus Paceibacterota bacterium]|nr:hypothetical protein [Candidatus Paceibacterota bacterium]HQM35105.1 hypothetical protein [Candidatus Paceibacterota bacterium]